MRILAIDIGTGTQDILLFDSSIAVENCPKMVMPSPTAILARRIAEATRLRQTVLFTGVTMGGGPSKRALSQHTRSGNKAYATPEAALTFNDDLDKVKEMGVTIVSDDEFPQSADVSRIELRDLDLDGMCAALRVFGVVPDFDLLAVAVLDHGFAPRGVSNRAFRFDHLRRRLSERNELVAFAYLPGDLPGYLTRMKAVADTAGGDMPVLMMDTGVAAAMGALLDSHLGDMRDLLTVNLGNSHTIAFHMHGNAILGLFEHHTGILDVSTLDILLSNLAKGTITNEEVYGAGGHGALTLHGHDEMHPAAVTGPRRALMSSSSVKTHQAVPYGDMMLTGCYGLVKACAERMGNWRDEIEHALRIDR